MRGAGEGGGRGEEREDRFGMREQTEKGGGKGGEHIGEEGSFEGLSYLSPLEVGS